MPDNKQRRQSFRFEEEATVKYKSEKSSPSVGKASTINLSTQGAKILTDRKLPIGSILNLIIEIPGTSESIRVRGKVVWLKEIVPKDKKDGKTSFQVGINFLNIGLKERSILYFKGRQRPLP